MIKYVLEQERRLYLIFVVQDFLNDLAGLPLMPLLLLVFLCLIAPLLPCFFPAGHRHA